MLWEGHECGVLISNAMNNALMSVFNNYPTKLALREKALLPERGNTQLTQQTHKFTYMLNEQDAY